MLKFGKVVLRFPVDGLVKTATRAGERETRRPASRCSEDLLRMLFFIGKGEQERFSSEGRNVGQLSCLRSHAGHRSLTHGKPDRTRDHCHGVLGRSST